MSMLGRRQRSEDDQDGYTAEANWRPAADQTGAAPDTDVAGGVEPDSEGTVRDGDGTPRRFTTVSWPPRGRKPAPGRGRDPWYRLTITIAFVLLVALAAATMYVSYAAQAAYVERYKDDGLAVVLEALAWDAGALVFALLGLATAMRGHSALRARLGNLGCIGVSVAMNAAPVWAGAETDLGALLVWAGPPLLYAAVSDTIILEIQNRALAARGLQARHASIWSLLGAAVRGVGYVLGWLLLMVLDVKRAPAAARTWYIQEMPYAPGRSAAADAAAEARQEALEAGQAAEKAKTASAAEIVRVERDAERRQAERDQAHAEQLRAVEERHAGELEELRAAIASAEERGRARLEEQAAQHRAALAEREQEVHRVRAEVRGASTEVEQLRTRLSRAHEALSLRQSIVLLYGELGEHGDPRHGDYSALDSVARDIAPQVGEEPESRTVRRYLREIIAAELTEDGHEPSDDAEGTRAAAESGSMIGGA